MVSAEESLCPQCAGKGKRNRVISVFYKCEDAVYTCEDKMCTYFVTDAEGNLVKFNKKTNTTSHILDRSSQPQTIDDELSNFFESLDNDYNGTTEADFSATEQKPVQVPVDSSGEINSVAQSYDNENENTMTTHDMKVEEIFKVDCSELNFDDFFAIKY